MKSVLAKAAHESILTLDGGSRTFLYHITAYSDIGQHCPEKTMTCLDNHGRCWVATVSDSPWGSDTICRASCKRKARVFCSKLNNVIVMPAALGTQVWALLITEPRVTICSTCPSLEVALLSADYMADMVQCVLACIPHLRHVGSCSLMSQEVAQAILECCHYCGAVRLPGESLGSTGHFWNWLYAGP